MYTLLVKINRPGRTSTYDFPIRSRLFYATKLLVHNAVGENRTHKKTISLRQLLRLIPLPIWAQQLKRRKQDSNL